MSFVARLMMGGSPDYIRLVLLSKMAINVFNICATGFKPEPVFMKHTSSEQAEQPQVMVLHGDLHRAGSVRILLFSQRPL